MPFEVGVDVVVGLPLEPLRLERAAVGNDALGAGPRREDLLPPALDHVLLVGPGEFLDLRRVVRHR